MGLQPLNTISLRYLFTVIAHLSVIYNFFCIQKVGTRLTLDQRRELCYSRKCTDFYQKFNQKIVSQPEYLEFYGKILNLKMKKKYVISFKQST
jgi:hypothetical protein